MKLIAVVFLVACTGGSGTDPGLAGKWSGTSAVQQHYDFTITDRDGALSGAGVVDPGNLTGEPISVEVTGAIAGADVSLRFDAGGNANALTFTGILVDADQMTGLVEGEPDVELSLVRIAQADEDDPPPQTDDWQEAEDRLVDARCNAECGTPPTNCASELHGEMAQARAELADADEPRCITCMTALAEVFESTTQPSCMPMTTDVFEVCDAEIVGSMVTLHACNGHPTFPVEAE